LQSQVAPNGVQVWVLEGAPSNEALLEAVRFQLSRQ
jgi:hypothetical protein